MKTVLITGGASGIGEAIAFEFAKNNYNVAINYFSSEDNAKKITQEIKNNFNVECEIFKCDVSKTDNVEEMFLQVVKRFGSIDVLVSNSGVSLKKLYIDCNQQDYEKVFGVNVFGAFNVSRAACKIMVDNQFGKIIFISSIFGEKGASCEALYSATKGAINSLTKSLAREMGLSNINVNAISCGLIDTKMNDNLTEEEKLEFVSESCLKRIGTPIEVAKTALFLASDEANYINGQIINVDGGF